MHFSTKSYLKSNRYHTAKHTLKIGPHTSSFTKIIPQLLTDTVIYYLIHEEGFEK